MIHYHGPEGTKESILVNAMRGRHFVISYAYQSKLKLVADIGQSFILDNGAFSFWRTGKETDWEGYYDWVEKWHKHPGFDWALIPDIIDGNEAENKLLVEEWPLSNYSGVPVWHLNESMSYFEWLCDGFPRVAIGSSGEYAKTGTERWWGRMIKAMNYITDDKGRPHSKLHGLRMLDPKIFRKFPFSSADSTNVARNHTFDNRWNGTYEPLDKNTRALVIANRIEHYNSAPCWVKKPEQKELF